MRLTLTDDDGTVLDSITITTEEFFSEVALYPHSTLAELAPGSA